MVSAASDFVYAKFSEINVIIRRGSRGGEMGEFSPPSFFFFFLSLRVALAKGSCGEPKPWSCLITNCGNNKTV